MKTTAKKKKSSFTRKKRRGLKGLLLFLVIAVAFIVLAAIFFRIGNISVSGECRYDAEAVIEASGLKKGDNIFLIDKNKAEQAVKDAFPYVASATVERHFPDKIVIALTEEREYVTVRAEDGWAVLSKDGKALDVRRERANLPELLGSGVTSATPGLVPVFRDETSLRIYRTVVKAIEDGGVYDSVSEINISKRYNITFDYLARVMINLGNTENLQRKIAAALICIEDHKGDEGKAEIFFRDDSVSAAIYKPLTDDEWIELKLGE